MALMWEECECKAKLLSADGAVDEHAWRIFWQSDDVQRQLSRLQDAWGEVEQLWQQHDANQPSSDKVAVAEAAPIMANVVDEAVCETPISPDSGGLETLLTASMCDNRMLEPSMALVNHAPLAVDLASVSVLPMHLQAADAVGEGFENVIANHIASEHQMGHVVSVESAEVAEIVSNESAFLLPCVVPPSTDFNTAQTQFEHDLQTENFPCVLSDRQSKAQAQAAAVESAAAVLQNTAPTDNTPDNTSAPQPPAASLPKTVPNNHYRITLPNAKQGEAYAADVVLSPSVAATVTHLEFTPECGLYWDAERLQCVGVPTIHGDVSVRVWWHANTSHAPQHEMTVAQLYINADPRSLWKNIPSDTHTLFWKPDVAADAIQAAHRQLLGARVRGRSHAHVGTCCDDDFGMATLDLSGGMTAYIAIVADGAGSAAFSRLGSQVAVNGAKQHLETLLVTPQSVDTLQQHWSQGLDKEQCTQIMHWFLGEAVYEAYAQQQQCVATEEDIDDIKQLATTLLIGLCIEFPDGQWLVGSYWVGDGAMALYWPEQHKVKLLGSPDSGQFSGETRFLSAGDWSGESCKQRVHVHTTQDMPVLIAMTDGVSDAKFETEQKMQEAAYWEVLWQEWCQACAHTENAQESAQALQHWLDFWSAGNHDDRTLVVFRPNGLEASWTPTATHTEVV